MENNYFEKISYVGKIYISCYNINNINYKIIREILSQNYGVLTIKKTTYVNNIKRFEQIKNENLSKILNNIKKGFYKLSNENFTSTSNFCIKNKDTRNK